MKSWSVKSQKERRARVNGMIREKLYGILDENAQSDKLIWWDKPREVFGACNAFFEGDDKDRAFANTIMRYACEKLDTDPGPRPFEANYLAGLLKKYSSYMDDDVRTFATDFMAALLPFGMTADFQFHGFNDNMPVMWTWALIAGSEFLNDDTFKRIGYANLQQLRALFQRRGTVSEYGASYSSARLTSIALLAQLSDEKEIRTLALDIEARIWAELSGHWSVPTAQIAGASMRGGSPFSKQEITLMWYVFGDAILPPGISWAAFFEESHDMIVELGKDPQQYIFAFPLGYGSEFVSAEYHVPERVAQLFYAKEKDFTFVCTTENGFTNGGIYCKQEKVYGTAGVHIWNKLTNEEVSIPHFPAHGAQEHGLITHHGTNYSLGSSTTNQWATSHAFRCMYRRKNEVQNPGDVGTVMVRYNINGKVPCGRIENTYCKTPEISETNENYCSLYYDQGHHHCLQHEKTIMCLQVPQAHEYWNVTSMNTDIFLSLPQEQTDLFVDGKVIKNFPVEFDTEKPVFINEGPVFFAIHPLICRSRQLRYAMKIRTSKEFLIISLYNYEGPSCEMTHRDMNKLGNGFVFEARDADDYKDFESFCDAMSNVRILDKLYGGVRRVHYARKELRLSMHLCPYTDTIKYSAVNGLLHDVPQLSYNGLVPQYLPFLDKQESIGFEDWDWIETQMTRPRETYNPQE